MINFKQYPNCTKIVIPSDISLSTNDFRGVFAGMQNLQYLNIDKNIEDKINKIGTIDQNRGICHNCNNLIERAICGPNVKYTYAAFYNCINLTNVTLSEGMSTITENTFRFCSSLTNIVFPSTIQTIENDAFYDCRNMSNYDLSKVNSLPYIYKNAFYSDLPDYTIAVPVQLYGTWSNTSNWETYKNKIKPSTTEITVVDTELNNNYISLFNNTTSIELSIINLNDKTPNISITPVNTNICNITDISTTKVDKYLSKLSFNINTLSVAGTTDINIVITVNDFSYNKTINMESVEVMPYSYTVESIEGSTYGFELNSNGYYESNNKGKGGSYAICKINITNPRGKKVYLDCINYGELKYDYGMVSNINTTLNSNASADTTNVKQSFKEICSANIQTVEYGAVEGYIYAKYIKDSSDNKNNDSLQFKVRFE